MVVLITGFFDVPKDVKSIWECYRELDLGVFKLTKNKKINGECVERLLYKT